MGLRSRRNPSGAKPNWCCLEHAIMSQCHVMRRKKVTQRAERRADDEPLAPMASRLQDCTSIETALEVVRASVND